MAPEKPIINDCMNISMAAQTFLLIRLSNSINKMRTLII
mgnify:CR=1 FL=1